MAAIVKKYKAEFFEYEVRDKVIKQPFNNNFIKWHTNSKSCVTKV